MCSISVFTLQITLNGVASVQFRSIPKLWRFFHSRNLNIKPTITFFYKMADLPETLLFTSLCAILTKKGRNSFRQRIMKKTHQKK